MTNKKRIEKKKVYRKKNPKKVRTLIFVLLLLIPISIFIGIKQKDKNNAQNFYKTYITNFTNQKFDRLVGQFDPESLSENGFSSEELTKKYEAVFSGMQSRNIKVKNGKLSKKNGVYTYNFTISLDTLYGKLKQLNYRLEFYSIKKKFFAEWSPTLILPGMQKGDTVFVSHDVSERGEILDRNDNPLATKGNVHQLGLNPEKLGDGEAREKNLQAISDFFEIPVETLKAKLEPSWAKGDVFVPVKTYDKQLGILGGLPTGSVLGFVEVRHYPLGEAAAQLVGYVGKATAEDIDNDPTLTPETVIGRSGLEQTLDKELRGQDGGGIYILKENGDYRSLVIEVKKTDGKDFQLTIDAEAQRIAYEELNHAPASTVITAPKTGELLVLASSPSFDPNKMTMGISQEDYDAYANDALLPFLSRFSTRYAPGSTFKTITAGIGLDYGTINPDEEIEINGLKWQKDESWGGYFATRVKETSFVNLEKALVYSDNIYFAQQTLRLGERKFRDGLNKFCFGEKFDLPISMPVASLSNEDKFNSEILLADTGYGQGELLISPIQQATMYSVFMNDGAMVYPSLLMDKKAKRKEDVLKASSVNLVLDDLIHGVSDADGYIHSLYNPDFSLAAKTGTAEIKEKQDTTGIQNSFLLYFDAGSKNFMGIMMVEDSLEYGTATGKAAPLVDYLEATYK